MNAHQPHAFQAVIVIVSVLNVLSSVHAKNGEWKVPIPYYGDAADVWQSVAVKTYEYSGYDGFFNNLAHPDWGAADTPMIRRLPNAYADGVYQPSGRNRPNPFEISAKVLGGSTGRRSERNRTAFLVFFGQQVVEEVLDAQRPGCPPEYFNISVPLGHHLNPENRTDFMMPLLRSRYDAKRTGHSPNHPREQLNEITPYIDGNLMYGPAKTWADSLRSLKGGRLLSTRDIEQDNAEWTGRDFPAVNHVRLPYANPPPPKDHYLKDVGRFFRIGNPRGNENPFLLTFGIFWYRWHNHVADQIERELWKAYNNATVQSKYNFKATLSHDEFLEHYDERIFNEARKWVIAIHQKIVAYDWIPSWLGTFADGSTFKLPDYKGYNPNVHPQIMHVFQSAAMRFGHTIVPPGVFRRRKQKDVGQGRCEFMPNKKERNNSTNTDRLIVRTCNAYFNPQDPYRDDGIDIDEFILGMSSQVTEREDATITPDLRGFVFGSLDFSRRDLMAINIQRGRDHGLPDYNTARRVFGLKEVKDWTEINPRRCGTQALLRNLSHVDCDMIRGLREVYNNSLADIDIWPAGIAETVSDGPGELFRTIIGDQFTRIRDGDRFWFENKLNNLFTDTQRERIWLTNLRQIILEITNISDSELAGNPFFYLAESEKCKRLVGRISHLVDLRKSVTEICSRVMSNCELLKLEIISRALSVDVTITDQMLRVYVDCDNSNLLKTDPCPAPFVVNGSNEDHTAPCSPLRGFDYFTGSETSYILTFLSVAVFTIANALLLWYCAKRRCKQIEEMRRLDRATLRRQSKDLSLHEVVEWQGFEEGDRDIKVRCDIRRKALLVFSKDNTRSPVRTVDCKNADRILVIESVNKKCNYISIKVRNDYDLVLIFDGISEKNAFFDTLQQFSDDLIISLQRIGASQTALLHDAVTKAKRKQLLDKFFRVVFKHAFRIEHLGETENLTDSESAAVIDCELSVFEFADALSMKPDSIFVKNMFELVDKDNNGFISFREFLDVIVIFAKGSPEDKAKLLFDMYDVSGSGELSKDNFRTMLKSLMELANADVEATNVDDVIQSMFMEAHLESREVITLDDFYKILGDYKQQLSYAQLGWEGTGQTIPEPPARFDRAHTLMSKENIPSRARRTILRAYKNDAADRQTWRQSAVEVRTQERKKESSAPNKLQLLVNRVNNYVEYNRLQIFWIFLYTLTTIFIFLERAYYFSVEVEHGGLRRIAGYGVTVTRGAASVQMFTYSTLLVTMCRNLITYLRETFLNRFIPFDSAVWFHKYVACIALLSTVIHVIGHSLNFYHISTQTPNDVSCIFSNYYRPTHVLPKFHYWCWNTITGVTGMLMVYVVVVIFVFSMQHSRRHLFRAFAITHKLYLVFFVLMILHGAGMLIQAPIFWTYFIGPVTLFVFDNLISISRSKTEITVIKAELLPSGVTVLTIKKPTGFEFRSGQWVRIACLELGGSEYHPFTFTSAPYEDTLAVHIRAVGPWTMNLRTVYDPALRKGKPYSKLYLDGPYGEGHQDWYKYEVAVLVGAGIGVSPFASILKDIVHRSSLGLKLTCKKVYFLWITRSQKHFEWMVDVLRDVEENDSKDFISNHIFITQFFSKFDLRTTMLYICERHFQKVSNQSLFTGLRSITHFGRPDFYSFLNSLQDEHPAVSKVGVFSCGPPPMTRSIEDACTDLNKERSHGKPVFMHHYENF